MNVNESVIYSELDIYPGGLPDVEDIRAKKKKRDEDKLLFEDLKNPPSTPIELPGGS